MKRQLALIIAMSAPEVASADCGEGGELLISCTFREGAKTVTTCLKDDLASYTFGPTAGEPELTMERHVRDAAMKPWEGFGRWISEGFTFANGEYRYHLRYAIDKLSEDHIVEGDLWVGKGETRLAELICDPGSVETSGYPLPLYDAKIAKGQEWDHEELLWRDVE